MHVQKTKSYSEISRIPTIIFIMNCLLILVGLVKLISSRDITTISYSEINTLDENVFADVFKNEGAFVRNRA